MDDLNEILFQLDKHSKVLNKMGFYLSKKAYAILDFDDSHVYSRFIVRKEYLSKIFPSSEENMSPDIAAIDKYGYVINSFKEVEDFINVAKFLSEKYDE
ncbi:MAG: hypothetical protein HC836_50435 [Richelia sp. RM2_1_2]|nr:hypothetical protein [Richelia sp. RM2_1_2]